MPAPRLVPILVALCAPLAAGAPQFVAAETDKLLAEVPVASAALGVSAAISGDTAVIGASEDDHGALTFVGAAYVYERDPSSAAGWSFVKKLVASDPLTAARFGSSVATDGDTIVVGSYSWNSSGAAYVFERDSGGADNWGEVAKLTPAVPTNLMEYGDSVAVSDTTVVVGASHDDPFGLLNAGAAYVYERDAGGPNAWGEVAVLVASDAASPGFFGSSVALDGDSLVVGANVDGAGGLNAGAAYVFERDLGGPGAWGEVAKLVPADLAPQDNFGRAVSISGDFVVAGSHLDDDAGNASGSAYVFARSEEWGEVAKLTASDAAPQDAFGHSVSVDGDRVVVGSVNDADLGFESGSAYVFERGAGVGDWTEVAKLLASDGGVQDRFGWSAAASGGTAVFGARNHDLGANRIEGLAFDPATNTLYGSSTSDGCLVRVDLASGDVVAVGPLGFADVTGLAFDPLTSTLFGVDASTDELITIDTVTGAGTAVGPIGKTNVQGLAFDPGSNTLYGSRVNPNRLITIDPDTGVGTGVGATGDGLRGLAFDAQAGALYGSDRYWLHGVDTATGATAAVGDTGFDDVGALAPGTLSSALHGADRDLDDVLLVDTGTGAAGATGIKTLVARAGAAYVFELSSGSEVYCTAGVSASGCQASLTASGVASATSSTGFVLTAADVEGAKDGLLFFGANGRQANSWGNGTSYQCVVPPVRRAGLLAGLGTPGACDGAFAQSLNALWCPTCPKPGHNPGAGVHVQAQLWYRDPLNTSNRTTSLSNAIEALVGP